MVIIFDDRTEKMAQVKSLRLILNWQNNTQVFRQIHVFLKNCLRGFG